MTTTLQVERDEQGEMAARHLHPVLGVPHGEVFRAVYDVSIQFRERIEAGQPKDAKVQEKWLETRGFMPDEIDELIRAKRAEAKENGDTSFDYVEEEVTKTWNGFLSDAEGLFIEGRQVKAMLRECATELGLVKANRGFRQRIQHGFFVSPNKLRLLRDESGGMRCPVPVVQPDGYRTKVVHTWAGGKKIAAFTRHDYVDRPIVKFQVWIVRDSEVRDQHMRPMLALAEEMGLGANRSQGEGKFDVIAFEKAS